MKTYLTGIVAMAGMLAGSASGAIIDFEGHPDDGNATEFEAGYTFTFTAAGWGIFTDGFGYPGLNKNGSTRLLAGGGPASVTFAPTGGGTFSLNSFDGAVAFASFSPGSIEVTGQVSGGGTVVADFAPTGSFATFLLPGTFTNLTSVTVLDLQPGGFSSGPGFELDNLLIDATPVPETSHVLLAAMAAIGVAGFVRRRFFAAA